MCHKFVLDLDRSQFLLLDKKNELEKERYEEYKHSRENLLLIDALENMAAISLPLDVLAQECGPNDCIEEHTNASALNQSLLNQLSNWISDRRPRLITSDHIFTVFGVFSITSLSFSPTYPLCR